MLLKEFYNHVLKNPFSSETELPFPVTKVQIKKGDIITAYGQIEDTIYFINNGIVEMTIKSYMTEKIIDFFFEKEMVCGFTSFLTQLPTDVQITALMDCDMETIRREHLMTAYESSLDVNRFGRILTEQGYIRKSDREKNFLTKTAEELYTEMFKKNAEYISNIPVNKIAKYLGIHPESLSRIRKKMNS